VKRKEEEGMEKIFQKKEYFEYCTCSSPSFRRLVEELKMNEISRRVTQIHQHFEKLRADVSCQRGVNI
jgi:hypothetical protein